MARSKLISIPTAYPGTLDKVSTHQRYTDHLVINMFALDGRPRILHIWGFESLQQRSELRGRHYAVGTRPPKGGPEHIDHATSVIALSNNGSLLS